MAHDASSNQISVATAPVKLWCSDCQRKHHTAQDNCEKCGACLYKHSTQIPDKEFPFFKCKKCGKVNFWD